MEQKGAIVALDERSQPAAPGRRDENTVREALSSNCTFFSVSTVSVQSLPVARVTDFDWERDQTVGIQLMLRPPERLPQKLLFPPPFAAT